MSKLGKIAYLVCGLSIVVLLVARIMIGGWINYLYIPMGLAGASFVVAIAVDIKFYFEIFTMRTTKHGMNMGLLILMGLVLMVAVNFLGVRFDHSFDMTKNKINTLSDQSKTLLDALKEDLQIKVFYRGSETKELQTQLKQNFAAFIDHSGKVKIEFVNALLEVELAKKYLQGPSPFVVMAEYKGKRLPIAEPYGEQETISTISKVIRTENREIYFLYGHGERSVDEDTNMGISLLKRHLEDEGYTVKGLNLLNNEEMPKPPAVLVIAGPKSLLTDGELSKIRDFARAGGRLMIAADPGEDHQIANLTKSFGVEFKNNYVINQFEGINGLGPLGALGTEYDRSHPITKKFYEGGRAVPSILYVASEVKQAPDAQGDLIFTELVNTPPVSYTNTKPRPVKSPETRAVGLAVVVKGHLEKPKEGEKKPEFIAVIFGDSDFMANQLMRFAGNRDLVQNSISYLADESDRITIRKKEPESTPLELTETRKIIINVAGLSIPLVLIILSGVFWFRRKSL